MAGSNGEQTTCAPPPPPAASQEAVWRDHLAAAGWPPHIITLVQHCRDLHGPRVLSQHYRETILADLQAGPKSAPSTTRLARQLEHLAYGREWRDGPADGSGAVSLVFDGDGAGVELLTWMEQHASRQRAWAAGTRRPNPHAARKHGLLA